MATLSSNFNDFPITSFLRNHVTDKEKHNCSVTGMGQLKGKWAVSDEEYPHFLDMLHDYLFNRKQRPINLVEQRRQDGYAPILIDLDFKYPVESAIERRFTLSNIHTFIEKYVAAITRYFDISTFESIRFFVTLRPTPYEDKKNSTRSLKDGVHIICPDLVLPSEYQQVIRGIVLSSDIVSTSFNDTNYINTPKDVFDESVVKKQGWFFLGESKPDIPAYSLVSIYAYYPSSRNFKEESITIPSRELIELLSIRYRLKISDIHVRNEVAEEWIQKSGDILGNVQRANGFAERITGDNAEVITSNQREGYTADEIALAKLLADKCLSGARADNYNTWMEVAWCLHSIDSSDDMFNCWLRFSSKSAKYNSNNVEQLRRDWNNGWGRSGDRFTKSSVHYWAKIDNPEEYTRIVDSDIIEYIERNAAATHTHVARIMQRMYIGSFRASVTSRNTDWYKYDGIWLKIPQGIQLRIRMTSEIAPLVARARAIASRKIQNEDGDINISFSNNGKTSKPKSPQQIRVDDLWTIEKQLYNAGFKDNVMKECIGLFYEENMAKRLNTNPYTIGFANGIIDLRSEFTDGAGVKGYRVEFRPGRPDDYISFRAGFIEERSMEPIDYVPYDPTDSLQIEIDDFMSKVFPNRGVREYMWRKLASCLEGTNREQVYDTWIGRGGNGKSKLVDLMSMTLGEYSSSLQSTAMTRKRPDSGAANPDIMSIRNKRFIYMSEPDEKEALNTSRMKQFTGEDVIEARGLFEDQGRFQMTGKLFMLCNSLPVVNSMDFGTWRRIRVVPFESTFVDPTSSDINPAKNIYPRDMFLDSKLRKWRTPFMSRLIHVYETEYSKNGLNPVPEIVSDESRKYQEMYDSFGKFMNSRLRYGSKHPVDGERTALADIIRVYREWTQLIGPGAGKRLTPSEIENRLTSAIGIPEESKKYYRHCRLFEDDASIEEFDNESGPE